MLVVLWDYRALELITRSPYSGQYAPADYEGPSGSSQETLSLAEMENTEPIWPRLRIESPIRPVCQILDQVGNAVDPWRHFLADKPGTVRCTPTSKSRTH